jgi:hypothetical protein
VKVTHASVYDGTSLSNHGPKREGYFASRELAERHVASWPEVTDWDSVGYRQIDVIEDAP